MFHDLDGTMERLLSDAPPGELAELRAAAVSFETPDRTFSPGNSTVDLFLYEIKENRELRDPVPVVERQGGVSLTGRPPLRAECSYLVTTWATGIAGARVAAEHRLLGQALAWLSQFPRVPAKYLQGTLSDPVHPLPTLVAQLDPLRQAGDFWTAMGVAPRPAFYLSVTVELSMGSPADGPLVTTATAIYGQERFVNFGGLISDAAGLPVTGAWVRLEPTGRTETTDAEGRFTFTRVDPRPGYTLRARAVGLGEASRGIDVPQQSGEYDLQFP